MKKERLCDRLITFRQNAEFMAFWISFSLFFNCVFLFFELVVPIVDGEVEWGDIPLHTALFVGFAMIVFLMSVWFNVYIHVWTPKYSEMRELEDNIERLKLQVERNASFCRLLVTQDVVDKLLRRLALSFHRAADYRNRLQSTKGEEGPGQGWKYNTAVQEAENARQVFWKELRTAQLLGFSVMEKVGDYLPEQQAGS